MLNFSEIKKTSGIVYLIFVIVLRENSKVVLSQVSWLYIILEPLLLRFSNHAEREIRMATAIFPSNLACTHELPSFKFQQLLIRGF